jgi:hypothetical protein
MWTFDVGDSEMLRATVQLTTCVEEVFHGKRLLSHLETGGARVHTFFLQPPAAPVARAGSQARTDAQRYQDEPGRSARLSIDTRAKTCELVVDGKPIAPRSFEEINDVSSAHTGLPPTKRAIETRQGWAALAVAAIFLAGSVFMWSVMDRIWISGFALAGAAALFGIRRLDGGSSAR